MNWKVLVEQFLEGYHIRSTHRETFFPLQYDNLNVVETFGRNSRVTYPYRNIERAPGRAGRQARGRRPVTFVYHLFPNVMLATFPDQLIVIVIDPDRHRRHSQRHLRCSSDHHDGTTAPRPSSPRRSLLGHGALEDDAMSMACRQRALAGANARHSSSAATRAPSGTSTGSSRPCSATPPPTSTVMADEVVRYATAGRSPRSH